MNILQRLLLTFLWVITALLVACDRPADVNIDRLNEVSYSWHYRNLDSTAWYANKAYSLSKNYSAGAVEALNNLAFVDIARMEYRKAHENLQLIERLTDNQIELLVADIQQMRLCQRQSHNKDFYVYWEKARQRLRRLTEEGGDLTAHQQRRLVYARTEYSIVTSAYFYYLGLTRQAINSLNMIDPYGSIRKDTAQLLNYWYSVGAGGIITKGTPDEIAQKEFDYLMKCFELARQYNYSYWVAQSMQAISEHLENKVQREKLIADNLPAMKFLNSDLMPDSLLAGNLALRSLTIFTAYGDVYQTAGSYRTLAECYWSIHDYRSALICLQRALNKNALVNQAPDLVASIREQLSLVYSAVNDKKLSDQNRNIYLDFQEQTRQDRQLEARASQLDESSKQLNAMILAVLFMIVLVVFLLVVFARMRKQSDERFSMTVLLTPLNLWQKRNDERARWVNEQYSLLKEQMDVVRLHLMQSKRRNLEQRAKIQLVNSVLPFIDRMVNEENRLLLCNDNAEVRQQRYEYIAELTDSINNYNDILTRWIQMRQGELSLKIESFKLQQLFDLVSHSRMSFQLKGINLIVKPTDCVVKADKTLTLFMINTIADNARKFTQEGDSVTVEAEDKPDSVEVSVCDTGCGMTKDKLDHIFDRTYTGGHGFGLKNCYGIIEKYKKVSRIFNVCQIKAESEVGHGTKISFRLPKGIARLIVFFLSSLLSLWVSSQSSVSAASSRRSVAVTKAAQFADSAYFSNINGSYERTLLFADSCRKYLTKRDTAILLDVSNEAAIAALALHKWDVYRYNNKVYTKLFREASADSSLPEYVRTMQRSQTNKTVAVVLLVILLIIIFPAYYFLYYRHKLNYSFCVDRVNQMNDLLLSDVSDEKKLYGIERLNDFKKFNISEHQKQTLNEIVGKIERALYDTIERVTDQATQMELKRDELRRLQMEDDRLHVSNSVLDNCLSTLKHETMYYPSRIRQLVDGTDKNLNGISELTKYYYALYQILSEQAMRQIPPIRLDNEMVVYLFDILRKMNNGIKPVLKVTPKNAACVSLVACMEQLVLTEKQAHDLFTPETCNLQFLLCRQIVREMGEATNLRACGISASINLEGGTLISIVMPERCWAEYSKTK